MSDFSEIVDSLENRISKLLHKMELLKQQNQELSEELTVCKHKNDQLHQQVANWEGGTMHSSLLIQCLVVMIIKLRQNSR